ncbi:MAG: 2-dehydropantoate 2-reductase [Pseudomonadota bacterium]|nr:2-dehydropantoate 2-reductase [Pseudomonadota bacterium]
MADATGFLPRSVGVLGAGAVGSYFGAVLARSGIEVRFTARAPHVEAIERDGLVVLHGADRWRVAVRASTDAAILRNVDVVLITVKTQDTHGAISELAPFAHPNMRVVSLQNGVDNAARIAERLPLPTYAAVVYVGAEMDGPGRVRHLGRGDLVLGKPRIVPARGEPASDLAAIAGMFEAAHVLCPVSAEIDRALWAKLTLNCALNAISAICDVPYGRMGAMPAVRAIMEEAVRETVTVAAADGVSLDVDELLAATWGLVDAMPRQYSSTAQDLQRQKSTEIDALNGYVAARGEALGVAVPVNRTLHTLVKLRESSAAGEAKSA